MRFLLKKIEAMHKKAYASLHIGLGTVTLLCIVFLVYIINADGFKECARLMDTIPSIAVSVTIVFGGSALLDSAVKETEKE